MDGLRFGGFRLLCYTADPGVFGAGTGTMGTEGADARTPASLRLDRRHILFAVPDPFSAADRHHDPDGAFFVCHPGRSLFVAADPDRLPGGRGRIGASQLYLF